MITTLCSFKDLHLTKDRIKTEDGNGSVKEKRKRMKKTHLLTAYIKEREKKKNEENTSLNP